MHKERKASEESKGKGNLKWKQKDKRNLAQEVCSQNNKNPTNTLSKQKSKKF